jgi:hypothetical protein
MTVGELKAALAGVRDEARLLAEVRGEWSWGLQFDVVEAWPIGGNTDDPGVVLKMVRTR